MDTTSNPFVIHFQKNDPILFDALEKIGNVEIHIVKDYFQRLCDAIISQQLSTKVADIIYDRFIKLFPGQKIDPLFLLAIPTETLREIGISGGKIAYLKNLAQRVTERSLLLEDLAIMEDELV
ncbi:MAG TPA: hypothetical protein VLF68_01015, partial [Candidatus Saccharimonadales bacterium]|nr:hypothetical protein [Candidatus Saccharimonadales bacterium]